MEHLNNIKLPTLEGGGGRTLLDNNIGLNDLYFWFIASDVAYYNSPDDFLKYLGLYDFIKNLKFLPKNDEIFKFIQNKEKFSVLSTQRPPEELKELFSVIELNNYYGLLTSQQKLLEYEERKVLEEALGLSVIKSPFTLASVGGAKALKKYTSELVEAEKYGFKAKGVFLVGIPGTGKTFFPKCFAGELGRLLIQLNISLILESSEPITKLNSIFEYLADRYRKNPDEKYVILIDEIEKMIGNGDPKEKRILGRLLSVLNDFNTEASEYDFNAIVFATANDLNTILDNNPEFLRRGRWDELFFINLPTHEYAQEIFNIYIKKLNIGFIYQIFDIDELFSEIEKKYQRDNNVSARFPYTAAEIENFCKRIDFVRKAKGVENITKQDIVECVEMIIPIVKTAREGINRMVGQKELFTEI